MSAITPFNFNEHAVRVQLDENGQPWFNARDVCEALEYVNAAAAVKSHVDSDDFQSLDTPTNGGIQKLTHLNESGLYSLVLKSKKAACSPQLRKAILSQVSDSRAILQALADFEVPDDLDDMYVYAIRNTVTGNWKLGISRDPAERLKQLQVGNDCRLELVSYRRAENRFADERQVHLKHADFRLSGEWFSTECGGLLA